MSTVTIRYARVEERAELEALQRRASLANPGDREALLANPGAISIPLETIESGHVLVAETGGAQVGFAAILPRPDGNVQLEALFVDPGAWRRGIGRTLVGHSADVARRWGATAVFVVGNPHAEPFYVSCGFRRIGSEETRFGLALLMRKVL